MAYDEELAERVREQLGGVAGTSEKKMFGGLAFLVGGQMAVAAAGPGGLMVRVDPADTDDHVAAEGVDRFEMRGRLLDGWLYVEPGAIATDAALRTWVETGVAYVATLPPKRA